MHPEDIKAALRKRGASQAKIARQLGVANTTVHNVIYGGCKSDRIAKFIANIIGMDRAEIWPGRYESIEERLRAI